MRKNPAREALTRAVNRALAEGAPRYVEQTFKTIKIKCEDDSPSYDQSVRTIIVERETDAAWFGRPLDNVACPTLEWPKFAWKVVF